MATRFTITGPGLDSGFKKNPTSDDLFVPPCGIEDVDEALFLMFSKEIGFAVRTQNAVHNVPVVFASGEKWAMIKRGRAIRDRNNTLILPLITIGRTGVKQDVLTDITGRGINQQTGALTIRRRLDKSDRSYQNVINRLRLKHQASLAVHPNDAENGQLSTTRTIGDLADDPDVRDGGLLKSDRTKNVYEVLTLPAPQFFSAEYEVTIWTQFTQHMNQLVERLLSSYLPQGNALRLDTAKGYWFVATVNGNTFNPENNFDDMTDAERIIKYTFTVTVPGYVVASDAPGNPVPVRRYVSSSEVTFITSNESLELLGANDPYLGSDDPTLPLENNDTRRSDQRFVGDNRRLASSLSLSPTDPALNGFKRGTQPARYKTRRYVDRDGVARTQYVRSQVVNPYTGETSYTTVGNLDDLVVAVTDQ
jgi:hypothetical protein